MIRIWAVGYTEAGLRILGLIRLSFRMRGYENILAFDIKAPRTDSRNTLADIHWSRAPKIWCGFGGRGALAGDRAVISGAATKKKKTGARPGYLSVQRRLFNGGRSEKN